MGALASVFTKACASATATAESLAVLDDEEPSCGEVVTGIPEGPCGRVLFDLPLNWAWRDATLLDFFGMVKCLHCYPDSPAILVLE